MTSCARYLGRAGVAAILVIAAACGPLDFSGEDVAPYDGGIPRDDYVDRLEAQGEFSREEIGLAFAVCDEWASLRDSEGGIDSLTDEQRRRLWMRSTYRFIETGTVMVTSSEAQAVPPLALFGFTCPSLAGEYWERDEPPPGAEPWVRYPLPETLRVKSESAEELAKEACETVTGFHDASAVVATVESWARGDATPEEVYSWMGEYCYDELLSANRG